MEYALSLRSYQTKDGTRYQVQWRDAQKRLRGRTFTSKSQAQAFDADIKARKFRGDPLPRPGRETLAKAFDDWLEKGKGSRITEPTRRTYKAVWNAHVRDRFDHHRLSELVSEPELLDELLTDMTHRGVGNASQRKVLVVLSAVLTQHVKWKKISTNPVWAMDKPPATRQRFPRPFSASEIEQIRTLMIHRETKDPSPYRAFCDAGLVSVMAYGGLRPSEALALTWSDVAGAGGGEHIKVDKALQDGSVGPTKTGTIRTVPVVKQLRDDLVDLSVAGNLDIKRRGLIFPGHDGDPWTRSEFNNWRNRVWRPILVYLSKRLEDPMLATARPYDCRATFVSLHLREGINPLQVAAWAGNSPAVLFKHYAGILEEIKDAPKVRAQDQIARARAGVAGELKQLASGELNRETIPLRALSERPSA